MRLILLILVFSLIVADGQSQVKPLRYPSGCWVNIDYVECMKKQLPCYCEENSKPFFALTLNLTKEYSIGLDKYGEKQTQFYSHRVINDHEYEINGLSNSILKAEGDTIYFFYELQVLKFIKSERCPDLIFFPRFIHSQNVNYLNYALDSRRLPAIEQIVSREYLSCKCTYEDGKNVLWSRGSPFKWLLNIIDNELEIDRVINIGYDLETPYDLQLLYRLKWD